MITGRGARRFDSGLGGARRGVLWRRWPFCLLDFRCMRSWKMVMMHGMVAINAHSLGSVGVVGNLIQTHKCFPLLACFQSRI
jgi:hypothetical protein